MTEICKRWSIASQKSLPGKGLERETATETENSSSLLEIHLKRPPIGHISFACPSMSLLRYRAAS